GVSCSPWVATDLGEAAPKGRSWRTAYRERISRVRRTELQEGGKPEHRPRHDRREEVGGRVGEGLGPEVAEKREGQGGGAEHPRREPDEVPNAEGEFRAVPGVLPPIPEPRDRRNRKATCPSPPYAG